MGDRCMLTVIQWLLKVPCYDMMTSLLVRALAFIVRITTSAIRYNLLIRLVKFYTAFPDDAAKTTANFLRSPKGVEQSL